MTNETIEVTAEEVPLEVPQVPETPEQAKVVKTGLFKDMAVGWDQNQVEAATMTNIALERCFMLEACHGTCKTTLCQELSKIYGDDVYRHYDATKDDLVSIASVPIPQELAKGKLVFSEHQRSLWKALFVSVDEISRASKENQNLWLEIMENKTLFGIALPYKQFIATRNPTGYASNFELDEALLDRFSVVIPIPDHQAASSDTIQQVIKLNTGKRSNGSNGKAKIDVELVKSVVADIKEGYDKNISNPKILGLVHTFVGEFMELLYNTLKETNSSSNKRRGNNNKGSNADNYISPRRWIHLTEEILGMFAYYNVVHPSEDKTLKIKKLQDAAYWSIFYTLATPLSIDMDLLSPVFDKVKSILTSLELTPADKIRLQLMKMDNEKVIDFLMGNVESVKRDLPSPELKIVLGKLLNPEKKFILGRLHSLCKLYGVLEFESMGIFYEVITTTIRANCRRYLNSDIKLPVFPPDNSDWVKWLKECGYEKS